MARLTATRFVRVLCEALGLEPNNTRRIVIDINADCLPIVHVELFGDEKVLDVMRQLEGVEIKRVDAAPVADEEGGQ